jgi:hypothetical protein
MNQEHRMPKVTADKRTARTTTTYDASQSVSATGSVSLGVSITKPGHQRNHKAIEALSIATSKPCVRLGKHKLIPQKSPERSGCPSPT